MLPWQQFKGRGLKNDHFREKYFVNFDFRNGTLPTFVKFHPQTTEIQPFKVEHSSIKTVKFHHYDFITYDASAHFIWYMKNSLIMSYPCEKFHHDMKKFIMIYKGNYLHFS